MCVGRRDQSVSIFDTTTNSLVNTFDFAGGTGPFRGLCKVDRYSVAVAVSIIIRDVERSSNIRTSKKIFEFEFVFDPSKFDFQIPGGLNSAKSVLWLH